MKKVSNGFVFDTETSIKLVTLKDSDGITDGIYKTQNGRYFYTCSTDGESIHHIKGGVKDLDSLIEEWECLGEVTVHFEEFEMG